MDNLDIFNAYFNFNDKYNKTMFRNEIKKLYDEKEKIRLIIDLENKEVGLSNIFDFINIRKVFNKKDLGIEKLVETIVICKDGRKKDIIQGFLKKYPPERTVIFI